MNPPVSFESLARAANTPVSGAYPYSLKGRDLDKNFVFATLDVDEGLIEETTGQGGHTARRLRIPGATGDKTLQLLYQNEDFTWGPAVPPGEESGQMIFWSESWTLSEAPEKSGQFLIWNEISTSYEVIVAPTEDGQFLVWDKDEKAWKYIPTPTADGQFLVWDKDEKAWKYIPTPTADGQILNWDQTAKAWKHITAPTQEGQLLKWDATLKNWVPFTAPPSTGTHVLGAVDGELQWIATEEC
jgi:hypothetical protein